MPTEKGNQQDDSQKEPVPATEAIDAVMHAWAKAYRAALDAADKELADQSKQASGDDKPNSCDSKSGTDDKSPTAKK
ncbi:hypothetical protein LMH87_005117 [Akanthomyces muscarius]|uniref:Uncharacterized protein n=1 Tax=Akanthomyces muscarius TaxID=2231603 RepID=A0A9W8QK26_AKAMU|nr:hypothetical protein LMH87_005117 [Akanthomyces muscarius]KAJ4163383.1 hypothetical protein LMH87_005117 [Akanthomyces muscarius]